MHRSRSSSGFTIVELLIVIVVIGILAAITIVAYNGITNKTKIALVQSDLTNAYTQLANDNTANGYYPATTSDANNGSGLKASTGTTYQYTYTSSSNSYCLTATNGSISYYVSSSSSVPSGGLCAGQLSPNGGVVTTFAGNSTQGVLNGTGTAAGFGDPYGIAIDSSNTMYVTDYANQVIRKVTTSAVVTTFAGTLNSAGTVNANGTSAKFQYPQDMVTDSAGNVYVTDRTASLIRKITPSGDVTTFAGGGTAGTNGTGTAAGFYWPTGITIDQSGNLYVSEVGNNSYRIRKITTPGAVVTTFAGSGAQGFTNANGTSATFNYPTALATDSAGNVYVTDALNYAIRKITPSGDVTTYAGTGSSGSADGPALSASFSVAYGIASDTAGNLYVADTSNNRIRKITTDGTVSTLAGSTSGYQDGTGTGAKFNSPYDVAVDSTGRVFVTDRSNYRIRLIQ